MSPRRPLVPLVLALLACAPACSRPGGEQAPAPPAASRPEEPGARGTPSPRAAAFDAGRAWRHLEAIVAMGPRLSGTAGHERFRRYVRGQLEPLGWTVTEQPFTYQVPTEERPRSLANVSAVLGERSAASLLLGTHWDTRPWSEEDPEPARRTLPVPGANDGGSGVAVLLEVARVLAADPPAEGVEIVLFDGEDLGRPGHPREYSQGAQHLVREWSAITGGAPLPAGVVVVDMVGDLDLRIPPERTAEARFPELTRRIWSAAKRLGHGRHFPTGPARAVFDDHRPFLEAGVPAALLIDFEYPWWHTQEDTIDKCSPESLATVGQVVLEALFAE